MPEISGYRWRYDIDAAAGAVFEISTGLILNRTRLELSLAQRKNSLDQMFRSITDYDEMAMEERRGCSVVSNTESSIDTLTVRTLVLNAYYDFPGTYRGISPYLGAGLGPAFVEVSGVHFSSEYEDTSGNDQAHNPPLSFYNSRQDANLSNTVLAGHLHAGADYSLNDKTVLGLKLIYSMMGDIEASSGYSRHPLSRAGLRLPQPQYVHRSALLDADTDRQTPVRQLNWSIRSPALNATRRQTACRRSPARPARLRSSRNATRRSITGST